MIINPEEAQVVQMVYSDYSSGIGAKSIAEKFNRKGYKYRGNPWSKGRILEIIGEEAYIGRYYFNRRESRTRRLKPRSEWIEIPVEPMVDEEIWKRAKALKESRNPVTAPISPSATCSKTLLTGIAKCGLCGASFALETAKGGKYTYYNCSSYVRKGKFTCPGQRIPADKLEKAVLDHMTRELFSKDRVKLLLKGLYNQYSELSERKKAVRRDLAKELDDVKLRLDRQYEAIESGVVDLQHVAERIQKLKDRRDQIDERLEKLTQKQTIPLHIFQKESIAQFQSLLRELFHNKSNRRMVKNYLRLFIEKIVIKLPIVEIEGKAEGVLAALRNKKAVRTGVVLTAMDYWLPDTFECMNFKSTINLDSYNKKSGK